MLNETPEELLILHAQYLPKKDLLNLSQTGKRYRRVLKEESDKKRYKTVVLCYRQHQSYNRHGAYFIISPTAVNPFQDKPGLLTLIRTYCLKLIVLRPYETEPYEPENIDDAFGDYFSSIASLFHGSSVTYFEAARKSLVGYGFPKSDRMFAKYLRQVSVDVTSGDGTSSSDDSHCSMRIGPCPVDSEAENDILEILRTSPDIRLSIFETATSNQYPLTQRLCRVNDNVQMYRVAAPNCTYNISSPTYPLTNFGYTSTSPGDTLFSPGYTPGSPSYSTLLLTYSPTYDANSPAYSTSSPSYIYKSPSYSPRSSTYDVHSPAYSATSPPYDPTSPSDSPTSSANSSTHNSHAPVYNPTSATYSPPGPDYNPIVPAYNPTSATNSPTAPSYTPTATYNPTSTTYSPTAPTYTPTAVYNPTSDTYSPTAPSYSPTAPYNPTTDTFTTESGTYWGAPKTPPYDRD